MDREALKRAAAEAALAYVVPGEIIGVGAGSTTEHFVRALASSERRPRAAVAASERSRALLESVGIAAVALSAEVLPIGVYVDGADEVDGRLRLIKGGGGALTREKVLATASTRFVCIVDETKLVPELGTFPLPFEVVPMAVEFVARELRARGGDPVLREDQQTDNGNFLLDVTGLDLADPVRAELDFDAIPGVVECGVFARRPADTLLVGTAGGVRRLERPEV
jgi:ribose 5-phosphate isomerase A